MSDDMSAPPPICRMMLTGCKAGWYGYVMGRFDEPEWLQRSSESFSSMAAGDKAGRRAMKILARKIARLDAR
jgi:hypothetical protein